ncbi:MAG: GntR family transcriptional regulator [Christensenellales bacterium]|jgi:GntR family transcriptional regulator
MINDRQSGDTQYSVNPSDSITLHSQIDEIFRKKILSGEWKENQRIPSERDCCAMFNVSRSTIRSVILQLIGEGLLYRVQGKGTFVSPPRTAMAFHTLGIRDKLDLILPTAYAVVTKAKFERAPDFVAGLFGVKPGTVMFTLERQRFRKRSSTVPSIYQYNYMPAEYGQGIDLVALPTGRLTYQLLEKYGLSPERRDEWLEAGGANAVESQALLLPPCSPVLITDELSFDANDQPYLFNRFVFPANQLRLSFGSKD